MKQHEGPNPDPVRKKLDSIKKKFSDEELAAREEYRKYGLDDKTPIYMRDGKWSTLSTTPKFLDELKEEKEAEDKYKKEVDDMYKGNDNSDLHGSRNERSF